MATEEQNESDKEFKERMNRRYTENNYLYTDNGHPNPYFEPEY